MTIDKTEGLTNLIIEKAWNLGACAAGIADVEMLKQSPSHLLYPHTGGYKSILFDEVPEDNGEVLWPQYAQSAIVIAVEHLEDKPELDWWYEGLKGGTSGNQILINIIAAITEWLRREKGCQAGGLPYYIVQGGIFLKDAAVMAGLGCIGKNNLLVTPDYGPRVRLRAAFLNLKLPATGPLDFDPCSNCHMPCRNVCPQGAFQKKVPITNSLNLTGLPACDGAYSKPLCMQQMAIDCENALIDEKENQVDQLRVVKYCRLCETSCPVGKK